MHWAGEFSARYLNWLGFRLDLNSIEKARRISTKRFETVNAAKKIRLTIVSERTGSRRWVDGHAADGIDGLIIPVRCSCLNRIHGRNPIMQS